MSTRSGDWKVEGVQSKFFDVCCSVSDEGLESITVMSSDALTDACTREPDETQSCLQWSIAQLLREKYPEIRLRERVRNDPLFEQTRLGDLLSDPVRYDAFLAQLLRLPQCGTTQVTRLRKVLAREHQAAASNSVSTKPLQMEMVSAPPSASPASMTSNTAKCTFYHDFTDAVEDVYFRIWRLAQFESFVYLPTSIPEFGKAPEVLAMEFEPGRDLSAYNQRVATLRNALDRLASADGVILLNRQALEAVFLRKGRYAALSQDVLDRQSKMLRELPSELPSGVTCRVCDFSITGLSTGTFIGNKAVISVMGGYLVIDDADFVVSAKPRLDFAREYSCPLSEFLEEIL